MRDTDFCICENKGTAKGLCFNFSDNTIQHVLKSEISSDWPSSDKFVLNLVVNSERHFPPIKVHIGGALFKLLYHLQFKQRKLTY